MFSLALKSIWNRRLTTSLSLCSLIVSVALLLTVERLRQGIREGFATSISQVDLIVGARGGSLPLLLYTVFHRGQPTANVSYETYQYWKNHPSVAWTAPISLGDSHRGFRVTATAHDFFENYRFRKDRKMEWAQGREAQQLYEVALGAEVARQLKYKLDDKIILAHGDADEAEFLTHDDSPFRVVGILKKTGTPLDRSLFITLNSMEAIHEGWQGSVPRKTEPRVRGKPPKIEQITAFFLRAKSRVDALALQREINSFSREPLLAILPGVVMAELWELVSYGETAFRLIASLLVVVSLLSLLISFFGILNERRREMAILRALGATPFQLGALLVGEVLFLATTGLLFGWLLFWAALQFTGSWIEREFGLLISTGFFSQQEYFWLAVFFAASLALAIWPARRVYKQSLTDGLTMAH